MSDERLAKHKETMSNWRAAKGEKQKIWKRSERAQWSLDVRKRDHYTCVLCRKQGIGRQMHAHHILAASQYPEWSLSRLNGITLCVPCHKSVHQTEGSKKKFDKFQSCSIVSIKHLEGQLIPPAKENGNVTSLASGESGPASSATDVLIKSTINK